MKCFLFALGWIVLVMGNCSAYAQPKVTTAMAVSKACNVLFMQFGWQDGQVIQLKDLQDLLKTMQLPENYKIIPQSAVEAIENLNALNTPEVIFHCTSDQQQLAPNTLVKFYFSYISSDNTTINMPEFIVIKEEPK